MNVSWVDFLKDFSFFIYLVVLWSEVVCEVAKYVGSEGGKADSKAEP
jgi:hypothetical protein